MYLIDKNYHLRIIMGKDSFNYFLLDIIIVIIIFRGKNSRRVRTLCAYNKNFDSLLQSTNPYELFL